MANEQISKITTVPTSATVIKIINTVIERYNSLSSIYTFKGSVQTYDDLLAIQNPNVGDVYNVVQEDKEHQIAAGSNFVWDGTVWDNLGGSLAGLVQSVNGINPDSLGNVLLPLIKNITTNQGIITFTKNDDTTTQVDNIKKLYMSTLGENVDLNNIKESGIYICASDAYAANYENCPIQKAFLLEVQALNDGTSNFVYQFLTQYNDDSTEAGNQYTRTYYYDRNWSVWTQMAKQSDLTNLSNSVVKSVNEIKPTNGNVTIDIPEPVIASEEEAQAGTDNTKFMTPLRVKQAIDALAANNGGIDSANIVQNGYIKFSNGLILQWGFKEHNNTHQSTVKLPIAFKKGGYVGAANDSGTVTIGIKPTDKQTIELRDNNGGRNTGIYWFVVGQ